MAESPVLYRDVDAALADPEERGFEPAVTRE
jgi:hypothetical protein